MTYYPHLKKAKLAVVILLLLSFLTGCWDRLEIEERMMVLGIAIDIASEEEMNKESNTTHAEGSFSMPNQDLIKLTVSIAVPGRLALGPGGAESGGGGAGIGGKPIWVLEIVGHSIDDALTDLEQQLEYELFLGHVRIIVVSEEFAKKGVRELSDFLRRNANIRRTAWMAIGQGKAADYMNITPEIERIPTLYIVSTLDQAVANGKLPQAFVGLFWSHLSSKGQDGYIPYIRIMEQDNIEVAGLAYFTGETMVGKTDPLEIGYFMSIMGMRKAGYKVLVPFHDASVTLQATSRHSQMYSEIRNGKPHFRIRGSLELKMTEKNAPSWSINQSDDLIKIQTTAQQLSKKGHEKLIKKMQESGSDIFGFGEVVRAKHAKYWNEHVKTKEKWKEIFPEVTFEVEITFHIRRIGMKAR